MMWLLKEPLQDGIVIAMPRIGLRELKIHASEVLRDVRDNNVRYVVTKRGEPQAIIVPYSPADETEPVDREQAWNGLADALAEVGRNWTSDLTFDELLQWMRR
jgi:prevent-host-death family protein